MLSLDDLRCPFCGRSSPPGWWKAGDGSCPVCGKPETHIIRPPVRCPECDAQFRVNLLRPDMIQCPNCGHLFGMKEEITR